MGVHLRQNCIYLFNTLSLVLMVRIPFHLSNRHLPSEDTMPCQAQVIALDEVKDTFMNYGFSRIDSKLITIYVRQYKTWTWVEEDVCDPKNCIHLLWVNSRPTLRLWLCWTVFEKS